MAISNLSTATIKSINLFCLFIAVFLMLFYPVKKEIWYDETVSIKCSKGISHDTPSEIGKNGPIASDEIKNLNTAGNVYHATIVDNGNSIIYNLLLHWFTLIFGNSVYVYEFFSRLCGVAALLAFFKLTRLFLGNTIFTSLSIFLFLIDLDLWGMSHEIRAYALGIFFVTMAVAHLVRFLDDREKPVDLLLTGLFSVGAVLSHFLSVYIIVVILCYLVFTKKAKLFAPKHLLAMAVPVLAIGVYFAFSFSAFRNMNEQNSRITAETASKGFSIVEVFFKSLHLTTINFKAVFTAFNGSNAVALVSFVLVIGLLITGYKLGEAEQKKKVILLFILGISSSIFLALLSIKAHHYTALYYRYFAFCVPFTALFVAYVLMIILSSDKMNILLKTGFFALFFLPGMALFAMNLRPVNPRIKYNHTAIARAIIKDNITKVSAASPEDILMVQCFLPAGQKVAYDINTQNSDFILYRADGELRIPLIKNDH